MQIGIDDIRKAIEGIDNEPLKTDILDKLNDLEKATKDANDRLEATNAVNKELKALTLAQQARIQVAVETPQIEPDIDLETISDTLARRPQGAVHE